VTNESMGSLRHVGRSIWVPADVHRSYPRFEGELTVDVAVIGGGITGLATALLLVEAGATVALLEADRISCGTTGYTTAKLTSLHGLIYSLIAEKHGEERARRYGEANQAAIEKVAELTLKHGIECDFARMPAYTYTEAPERLEDIENEVSIAQDLGLPASVVSRTDLPFEIAGAIRFDDQAMFHPRKYCLGLAALVAAEGGHVFEDSAANRLIPGDPCTIETGGGKLRAEHVVQATQFPFHDTFGLFTSNFPSQSYGLAIPIDQAPPQGMYLSAGAPTRSIRPYTDDQQSYVIVAGEGHNVGKEADTGERYRVLEEWAKRYFGGSNAAFRWSAHDYISADRLPYIGRLGPDNDRLWAATGYGKWGLTNGTVAAMILSDSIAGRHNDWASTFDSTRLKPKASAKKLVELQEELNDPTKATPQETLSPPDVETVGQGEARVLKAGAQKLAIYRDPQGDLHALSAVCTHMGCTVAFNTAERTWDCPCHGSRFDTEGRVVHGPATKPLNGVRLVEAGVDTAAG
jgi:glycine/D-amino acid oxidase-like deaminating enzyme/nitrite reductase/ring-hydroxylating ferredoxin subunit